MSLLSYKSKNPFRNFVKNVRSVMKCDKNNTEKLEIIQTLYSDLPLKDYQKYFYSHPSQNSRFNYDWWNSCARNLKDSVVTLGSLNPWTLFLDEVRLVYENSYSEKEQIRAIQIAIAWFYQVSETTRGDWVK